MSNLGPLVTAVLLQRVIPSDTASKEDLKKLMLDELFPSIDTSSGDLKPDVQELLGDEHEYLWISRFEYPVHATPFPAWLLDRVDQVKEQAQAKLGALATITSADLYYDAAAVQRIFGFA